VCLVWIIAVIAITASENAKTRLRAGLQSGKPLRNAMSQDLSLQFSSDPQAVFSR
jgi:hypothetical protein